MNDQPTAHRGGGRVVVGIDGSEHSLRALDSAADESQRRGADLEMLYVTEGPLPPRGHGAERLRTTAAETVDAAGQRAEARAPGLRTVPALRTGSPAADALLGAAGDAALTVIGARGGGGFAGLAVGSTGLSVAARCAGPLLTVGASGEEAAGAGRVRGTVLVTLSGEVGEDTADSGGGERTEKSGECTGGDGGTVNASDRAALSFGFEEAARRGATLRVLHVWPHPGSGRTAQDARARAEQAERAERAGQLVRDAVAPYRARHPGIPVRVEVRGGGVSASLVEASRAADVVVLASHRSRRPSRRPVQHRSQHRSQHPRPEPRLGSVAHALLHHAHCPVALLPTG